MKPPTLNQIKSERKKAGLTQSEAAKLIYKALRTWQQYEAGDREMDPAYWELFKIKSQQIKEQ